MHAQLLWRAAGTALLSLLLPCSSLAGSDAPRTQDVQSLLDEGDYGRALELAETALEYQPEDVTLLQLAVSAAEGLENYDLGVYYAKVAVDILRESEDAKAAAEKIAELEGQIAELDLIASGTPELVSKFEEFTGKMFDLGKLSASRKLWVNAADCFLNCRGTSLESRARGELDKLYANKKAATALVESGVELPAVPRTPRELRRLAARDADHSDWEECYESKTSNYEIKTNFGYEVFQSIELALEQMNKFYRKVFSEKNPKRIGIRVYATRKEFDWYEGRQRGQTIPQSVGGFFNPRERYVATYNPLTIGRPMSELWSTLFHEASHQFTEEISKDLIPTWLNEGTASYFEGARLLPNRSVTKNDIPEGRLRSLKTVLKSGNPTLQDVVSYHKPGSYPGRYYPVGWGLAYFMHNYENEKCERVYLKPYQDFLKSYRRDVKADAFDHFLHHFVKKAGQPEIKTFEDFEARFREWILELHENYFGPSTKYDTWIEKAQKQRSFGKDEAAQESYRFALRKRPEGVAGLVGLAEILTEAKQKDAAIFYYRKALREAAGLPAEAPIPFLGNTTPKEFEGQVIAKLEKLDRKLATGVVEANQAFTDAALEAAQAYAGGGYPRQALTILNDTIALLGPHRSLTSERRSIGERSGVELRRWRRAPVDPQSPDWSGREEAWQTKNGRIVADTKEGMAALVYRPDVPERYQLEVAFRDTNGENPTCGLIFGINNESPSQLLRVNPRAIMMHEMINPDEVDIEKSVLGAFSKEQYQSFKLRVDVEPGRVKVFVDDKAVKEVELDRTKCRGNIGIFVQGQATIESCRLLY